VYISSSGYCSRREADRLIESKRVLLNGEIASIGMDVTSEDELIIDGKIVKTQQDFIYLLYHKPLGIETTTDQSKPNNIIDAISYPERIFPVGRLDKYSSGLIILTSDGQIVNKILRSENAHEKEYIVEVDSPISSEFISKMQKGVEIYNPVQHVKTLTLPSRVTQLSKNAFKIVLTQGLNLQIRRMAKALGYNVNKLHRIRIMNLKIDQLPVGKYRHLTDSELKELFLLIN